MSEIMVKLNAKTSQMDNVGISTGEKLTAQDIAAACFSIDRVTENLLYAHICGDKYAQFLLKASKIHNKNGLMDDVQKRVIHLSKNRRWNLKEKHNDKLKPIACLAIDTVCQQPMCKACNGTKYREAKLCGSCSGTGVKRDTSAYMARVVGVNQTTFIRYYAHIYADIVAMLQTLILEGQREVNYQAFSS